MPAGKAWVFAVGYNGFRQLSLEDDEVLDTPKQLQSINSYAKSLIHASWDKVILQNENDEIVVKGFCGEKEGERVVNIHFGNEPIATNDVTTICGNGRNVYCITKAGKVGTQTLECIPDTGPLEMENIRMDGHTMEDVCMEDISDHVYCLTDKNQVYRLGGCSDLSLIPLPAKVSKVTCGVKHCLALVDTGVVYSWGNGSRGQLGHGCLADQERPKLIDILCGISIVAISAGGWHSAALASTGDLYVWGWNESGQLGFPALEEDLHIANSNDVSFSKRFEPVPMLNAPTLLELETYVKSDEFVTVTDVSCGARHSGAVLSDGRALTWGWAKYGQLAHACCYAAEELSNHGDSSEKRRKTDVSSLGTRTKCSENPHLPGLVDYFVEHDITVTSVKCVSWNTFFKVNGE